MPIGQSGSLRSTPHLLWRPIVLLTACIVIAGVGLAWFIVRTVIQERAIAVQESRDAATAAASRVAEGIVPELERRERALRVPAAADERDRGDEDSILLLVGRDRVEAGPSRRLLYHLEPASPMAGEPVWPATLRAAEALELCARDNAGAIAAYRAMLQRAGSNSPLRLAIQRRLAGSLRKAARAAEALDVLQAIIGEHPADSSPALAAAWYDRCAIIQEDHSSDNQSRIDYPQSASRTGSDSAADASASPAPDTATITVEDGKIVWRVTATPDSTRDPRRGMTTRTGVYLGTLGLMLLSVALAGYFAIRTVRQELEVARLKSEFVSTVSHEFRSPLSAISHLAELLDMGRVKDEDRKREYYRLILGESGRLRRLVENLLNFARIEDGRQQFQFEPTDVGRWLRPAVDEFQASLAAGKQVVLEIASDLPPVRADAEAMTTVLVNLLDNAVKYSPDSARVWVEASLVAGAVEIRVRDEGAGIAEEDQTHIFERFYRARDTRTVAGTGLGLALVQRIVAAHGGTVDVESRAGKGSTFRVRLPAFGEEKA